MKRSESCERPSAELPDFDLPPLPAGVEATATVTGVVDPAARTPLAAAVTTDDPTPPPVGRFRLTFVHAAPGVGPVDFGLGARDAFRALVGAVAFGDAGASTSRGSPRRTTAASRTTASGATARSSPPPPRPRTPTRPSGPTRPTRTP